MLMPLIWLIIVIIAVVAGRLFLREVGIQALAKVPETAKLVPTSAPNWQNRALIDSQTSPLKFRGFEDVGSYQVASMPGVLLKVLFHQATNVAAHVYEHPRAGSWTELATRYTDGRSATISDLPDQGVSAPPWVTTTRVARATPTDQMFQQHTSERDKTGIKTLAPADTVREFEDGYARYMQWKKGTGISADEVARVAKLRKQQGAGK
jgi:hypothetical protein